jgi:hypothetical protein
LHWLEAKFLAVAPAPFGGWVVGLVCFFYAAALLCGLTAFVLSMMIWHTPWPPTGIYDPIFRNPLFWLTWLAVMTAIMMSSIVCAVVMGRGFGFGLAQLRKVLTREGR